MYRCADLKTGTAGCTYNQPESQKEEVGMKTPRVVLCATFAAAYAIALPAQQAPSGFHAVNCIKVNPQKSVEFRHWIADVTTKMAQSRVESGAVSEWYLLRAVIPMGASADCDYVTVTFYPGAPPEPLNAEQTGALLKKAGIAMSAEEFMARRDALATLKSADIYRNQAAVGKAEKGSYLSVNYMKAPNVDEWLKFEKETWKPIAEAMIKDGVLSGWSLNLRSLGLESDLPYQGVSVDVFPSWDALFKDDPQFIDRIKKVYPDKDLDSMLFQRVNKVRTMVRTELYVLEIKLTCCK